MENEKLFELMEKMYVDMNSKMDKIYTEVKSHGERLDTIEKTVTKIENDHGPKIEALLDGYKQNSEQLNRIESEVSRHEEVIIRRIK